MTEHIVSQSPLSHSICLLSSCGLKIKCSQVESTPMGVSIAQHRSNLRKIHSFKVWRVKIVFKKRIIHMAAHDGLFSHLIPNKHLLTNDRYLLSHRTEDGMKHFDKVIVHHIQIRASRSMVMGKYCPIHQIRCPFSKCLWAQIFCHSHKVLHFS
jgi:hypothetical protein